MVKRNKLRLAICGTGYFSKFHFDAWSRIAEVDCVGICSHEPQAARAVAEKYGVAEIFEDLAAMLDAVKPDLVDIITPPQTHLGLVSAAAARGVSVICQKPFCQSLGEAEQAVKIASDSGVMLAVHENFRFQPWYREIKRLMHDGALGKVYQATFRLRPGDGQGAEAYLDRQPYFQKMQRFLVHETGIHFIDVFRYLFGEITGVYAQLARLNPVISGEDAGQVLFDFATGTRGLFDGNRLVGHGAKNRRLTMGEMLIEGEDAVLRLNGDGQIFLRRQESNHDVEMKYDWSDRGFGGDCVFALQTHIVAHLLDKDPLQNAGHDYLANLAVEAAIYRSNDTRRWIGLNETRNGIAAT